MRVPRWACFAASWRRTPRSRTIRCGGRRRAASAVARAPSPLSPSLARQGPGRERPAAGRRRDGRGPRRAVPLQPGRHLPGPRGAPACRAGGGADYRAARAGGARGRSRGSAELHRYALSSGRRTGRQERGGGEQRPTAACRHRRGARVAAAPDRRAGAPRQCAQRELRSTLPEHPGARTGGAAAACRRRRCSASRRPSRVAAAGERRWRPIMYWQTCTAARPAEKEQELCEALSRALSMRKAIGAVPHLGECAEARAEVAPYAQGSVDRARGASDTLGSWRPPPTSRSRHLWRSPRRK